MSIIDYDNNGPYYTVELDGLLQRDDRTGVSLCSSFFKFLHAHIEICDVSIMMLFVCMRV